MSQPQYPQQPGWGGPQQGWGAPPPQPPRKSRVGKMVGFGCLGFAAVVVLVVVIGAVAMSGGSSGDSVTSKPVSSALKGGQPTAGKADDTVKKSAQAAKVGDTISLKGTGDGTKLDVTVVKVADPAKSSDEFTTPDAGKRYVGVQFRLVNTGSAAYDDSPSNGAQLADSGGQRFDATFADITAGPSMASAVKLQPGGKALGWIVFEVPKGSNVATVQFTMNSGFADQTGEWKLS
jgi:hypothetical protein